MAEQHRIEMQLVQSYVGRFSRIAVKRKTPFNGA